MRIVVDENIPLGKEYFSGLGQVTTVNPRKIQPEDVRKAHLLIVRSGIKISAKLLDGSDVQFVGTCTAGFDHIDTDYLSRRKIEWCRASGCNANSVVEYVFSALSALEINWLQCRFGVIGCGNVGGLLLQRLDELGVGCVGYDPFLNKEENPLLGTLTQALTADVVCVHTPLTKSGEHPTFHMLSAEQLRQLKPNAVLINAGRGSVVNNTDLLQVLGNRTDLKVVLDVWEGEPNHYSRELLNAVDIATPHIAGHSYDGKVRGTKMIYERACEFLGVNPDEKMNDLFEPDRQSINFNKHKDGSADVANDIKMVGWRQINQSILSAYDVRIDHQNFFQAVDVCSDISCSDTDHSGKDYSDEKMAQVFHGLRKNYPMRLEFPQYSLGSELADKDTLHKLKTLGFQI